MLNLKKRSKKKFNIKKYKEKRARYIAQRRIRGSVKLLKLVLQNLKHIEIKKGFRKREKIANVYENVKKCIQRRLSSRLYSQRFIFSKAVCRWKNKIYSSKQFYKLKRSTFRQFTSESARKTKFFIKRLGGKRYKKLRKLKKIRAKRLNKSWLLVHKLSIFSQLYLKRNRKKIQNKFIPKKAKKKSLRTIQAFSKKLSYGLEIDLRDYEYLGTYEDFDEDYEISLSSTERPKKFVREYLSSFLYSGKPMGSLFGVYLGFHYYVKVIKSVAIDIL
jgi:hypothetical protein